MFLQQLHTTKAIASQGVLYYLHLDLIQFITLIQ